MKKLNSAQLRSMYLDFFSSKGHAVIGSASLIPENDPTVLFTTAGMHPLVPYLLGEKHPLGTRLTNVQKCVRTIDIDEVGDNTHCTFFEMLGNWSLGDYFKRDAIKWSFEFLTSPNYLNIPIDNLAVSVFAGDDNAPRDEESAAIWAECGIPAERIFYLPYENNWWGPAGQTGPCGPDTEMFIDTGKDSCSRHCSPACDCGKYIEIWNDVFMQYNKTADGKYLPLKQKNVDTGMGLERTVCILNGLNSVYETDLFSGAISEIERLSGAKYGSQPKTTRAMRIIADHVRTAVFMIGDQRGITPSNVDQGYVLRRLLRRAVRLGRQINLKGGSLSRIAEVYVGLYGEVYPELSQNAQRITSEIDKEENRFLNTLSQGLKEFEKLYPQTSQDSVYDCTSQKGDIKSDSISAACAAAGGTVDGKTAFRLYDTFGFPIEITLELAAERGLNVDLEGYRQAFTEHQKKSQAGGSQRFKGGLADSSEQTTKLHTATHLLHAALREVLGAHVEQRGSNITAERLRFDFNFERPMTQEEIDKTQALVNGAIAKDLPVVCEEMNVEQAQQKGAIGIFTSKYGEKVKVYSAGDFSSEICGGPHVRRTGEIGSFTIVKEQSSSAGVRRIKAVIGEGN